MVEDAVTECENTLRTNVEITPDKIKGMLDFFEQQARTIGINAWGRCSGVAAL